LTPETRNKGAEDDGNGSEEESDWKWGASSRDNLGDKEEARSIAIRIGFKGGGKVRRKRIG